MSRRAVTEAQIRRAVRAFAAMGKTLVGGRMLPDGSMEYRLTDSGETILTSADQAEAEWDRALGLQ